RVSDVDRNLVPLPPARDVDPSTGLGELRRVREQVDEHLLQSCGVPLHADRGGGVGDGQPDATPLDDIADALHRSLDDVRQVYWLLAKDDSALRDTRDVQEVVDQPRDLINLPARDLQSTGAPRLVEAGDRNGVAYRGERVAQLVAEHREEFV